MIRKLLYLYILLFLLSCQYSKEKHTQDANFAIIEVVAEEDSLIRQIIQPYKDSIEEEMNKVITYTKVDLKKNQPEGTLGNFVTDLCLDYAEADICLMNNGGLRTSINIGNITTGKIYELMPFENELVLIEIAEKDFIKMAEYIIKKGGEPFSGMQIKANKKNEILNIVSNFNFKDNKKIKVLTSDYLANKIDFFKNKKQIKIGLKLRDAILDYCIKKDTIDIKLDNRIIILEDE